MPNVRRLLFAAPLSLSVLVLSLCLGALPATASPFVYVSNANNTISVIDAATDTVTVTIPLSTEEAGWVLVTPGGERLYVIDETSGTPSVSVVDVATNSEIEDITGLTGSGGFLSGMAIIPDGTKAYVGDKFANRLVILNPTTNAVIGSIAGVDSPSPEGVVVSPDGRKLYVAANTDPRVTVVDIAADTVSNIIVLPPGSRGRGLAFLPDGSKAYVAIEDTNLVAVIDTFTENVVKLISGFNHPTGVVATPDGSAVYVSSQGPTGNGTTVQVIDTVTDTITLEIDGFVHPYRMGVTPDGAKVYVAERTISGDVAVIDTATNTLLLPKVHLGGAPNGIAIHQGLPPVFQAVAIDIKPGSDPNSINLSSAGVIPVAIFSTIEFDATTIDPDTVSLAGATVRLIGKAGRFACHDEWVNDDDLFDLVCQVETVDFIIEVGQSVAVLEAETFDGISVRGEDDIRIVPDQP